MSLFAWTFAVTSSAWFLFALDRLVVTTALPSMRTDLGAGLALYARLGYRRAPEFDRDMNAHYGLDACRPWSALAYLKHLPASPGGTP